MIVREVHSRKVTVAGAVKMPGRYELKSPMTVLEVIALAQGLTDFASRDRIVVLRQNGKKTERIPFNYRKIADGAQQDNFFDSPRRHRLRSVGRSRRGTVPRSKRICSMARDPLLRRPTNRSRFARSTFSVAARSLVTLRVRCGDRLGRNLRALSAGPVSHQRRPAGRAAGAGTLRAPGGQRRAREPPARHQAGDPEPRPAHRSDRAIQSLSGFADAKSDGRACSTRCGTTSISS